VPAETRPGALKQGCQMEYGLGYKIEFLWWRTGEAVYFFSTMMAQGCAIRGRDR
jgi:hypothetical protein